MAPSNYDPMDALHIQVENEPESQSSDDLDESVDTQSYRTGQLQLAVDQLGNAVSATKELAAADEKASVEIKEMQVIRCDECDHYFRSDSKRLSHHTALGNSNLRIGESITLCDDCVAAIEARSAPREPSPPFAPPAMTVSDLYIDNQEIGGVTDSTFQISDTFWSSNTVMDQGWNYPRPKNNGGYWTYDSAASLS